MGHRDTLDVRKTEKTIFYAGKSNSGQSSWDSVVTTRTAVSRILLYVTLRLTGSICTG